ncbi:MAG: hypothetical protein IJN56_04800 [Clostridia bacterium]|nr:hypothetical protein [Clostridia bacterium]
MEFLLNLAKNIFKDLLEPQKRPSLSNIIYFVCGIIEIIIIISIISPFHISCDFMNNIEMNADISNTGCLIHIAFWGLLVYIIVREIRKKLFRAFPQKDESELRYFHAFIYVVDDIVDVFSSIFSLLFILAVFIQFYKTQVVFASFYACVIYVIVAVRFFALIGSRAFAKNLEIIDKALSKQNNNK